MLAGLDSGQGRGMGRVTIAGQRSHSFVPVPQVVRQPSQALDQNDLQVWVYVRHL